MVAGWCGNRINVFVSKYHFTIKQSRLEQFKHFFYRNSAPPWNGGQTRQNFIVFGPSQSEYILQELYCYLLSRRKLNSVLVEEQSVSQSVSLYNVVSERNPSLEVNIVLGSAVMGDDDI